MLLVILLEASVALALVIPDLRNLGTKKPQSFFLCGQQEIGESKFSNLKIASLKALWFLQMTRSFFVFFGVRE
jgi:hypothetical protein